VKQVCTTRVRYVVKNFPSTGRNSSLGLSVVVAACVVALTPCQTSTAEPMWGQSNNSRNSGAPPLLPRPGDIFNGATSRPEIALPTGNFGEVPSVRNIIPPGAAANAGAAMRNIQNGNPMGAFRAIGGADQQGTSMIPAVGQIAGAVGAGRTGLPSGVSNIARTVQSGAQVAGAVGQIQSTLGRFQQGGGSGLQNVAGMVGGVAGVNQALGGFSQGGSPNLNGILQGLGGGTASSMFGNGIGAGPFGQFMGQNNQLMQGMQFVAVLQQLFGMFFPADSAMQFNNANTGQSARAAFANLMGVNAGSTSGSPFGPPAPGACDNSQAYRDQYQRVYNALEGTRFAGPDPVIPDDGDRYGIVNGTREEWANFFTRLARVESGYKPGTAADINGKREGTLTSFGMYQMGRAQFNTYGGGDIFNANDNTNAFVRYAEGLYFGDNSYGKPGGGRNVIGAQAGGQWLGISAGYGPLQRTTTGSQNENESFLLAANAC
jgi:hypothetical protein